MSKDILLSDEELKEKLYKLPVLKSYMFMMDGKPIPTNYNLNPEDCDAIVALFNTQKRLYAESDGIVLACPEKDCHVAIVSSRQLSRYQGTGEITDPPHATTVWLPCEKHYQEGAVPFYTDRNGIEISADPSTWNELRAEQRARIK